MASLRVRLLAAVLALTAAGLLLGGAITYFEQRSFLVQRVDQQARSGPGAVAFALHGDQGFGAVDRDHDRRGRPPQPDRNLPLGTYGEGGPAAGKAVGPPMVFPFGKNAPANPDLPTKMPVGKPFTVHGENGDDE